MKKEEMSIQNIQNDIDYIILSNPFASPKFVKSISKTEVSEISITDTYSRKLFYEIISRLKPEYLENIKINENVIFDIEIKTFAEAIGAENSGNFYTHIKKTARYLRNLDISFKTKDGKETTVGIISKVKDDEKGKMTLFIDSEMAEKMLEIDQKGNFSFLKEYIFKLQNGQAIKLYPFFKRWANHKEPYYTDLERFKEQFGFNKSVYSRFSMFENRILIPAIAEINLKTDIIVNYQTTGDSLDTLKPRVKGLIFIITGKEKVKQLSNGERHQPPKPQDEQTHISNIIPKTIPTPQKEHKTNQKQPSQAEIIELGEKAKLTTPQIEKIQELYRTNIRAWEAIKAYLTAPNKATIQNQFAYIIDHKSVNTLGVGIWEAEREKIIKRQKQEEEQRNAKLHEAIKEEYRKRKETKFEEFYNNATEKEKAEIFEIIKNNPKNIVNGKNYKIDDKGELKFYAINEAGGILAEKRNYGLEVRQNEFREEVFKKFNILINYDENDIVLIVPNLFQEQKPIEQEPQEQTPLLPYSPEKIKNDFSEKEKTQNLKKYQTQKRQPKKIEDKKATKREAKQPEPQEPAEPMATASQPTEQEQTPEIPIIQHTSQEVKQSNDEPLHIGNLLERTFSKFFKK